MPIFELICSDCGAIQERYLSRAENPDPPCEIESCGGETRRMISNFGIVWCGSMSRYNDLSLEVQGRDHRSDGHWAVAKNTPDGKPQRVWIDSIQKQKEFCRSEGLVPPTELPTNAVAVSDKKLSSIGMPGCWH